MLVLLPVAHIWFTGNLHVNFAKQTLKVLGANAAAPTLLTQAPAADVSALQFLRCELDTSQLQETHTELFSWCP